MTIAGSSGTFAASAIIRCAGNWSSDTSFDPSDGSVELDGLGIRTLGGTSPNLFNLRVVSGTVNATSALDIDGNLTIDSGANLDTPLASDIEGDVFLGTAAATWTLGSATHTVAGDWTSIGASATGAGTIELDGTGTLSTAGGSISNVSITAGTRTAGNSNVSGTLSMTGGTLEIGDNQTLSVAGNAVLSGGTLSFDGATPGDETLDVEGDCTITATAGSTSATSFILCAGNWSSTALFAPAFGVVRLDGGTTTTVGGTSPVFASLRIVSGSKTLTTTATLTGNLRIDSNATFTSNAVLNVAASRRSAPGRLRGTSAA